MATRAMFTLLAGETLSRPEPHHRALDGPRRNCAVLRLARIVAARVRERRGGSAEPARPAGRPAAGR
jgi:hypothetical protein